jgi:plastocyanin
MMRRFVSLLILGTVLCSAAFSQDSTVTAKVSIVSTAKMKPSPAGAVVWLEPLDAPPRSAPTPQVFTVIQKDKAFDPHVLAVPKGSRVAFPNFDPFFHNVFSMFDGRRFDLGLYEAGASRTVNFPRTGVCYIFCNIHPEMSAVIVVVDTPYYAVANSSGQVSIPRVPDGRYRLNVWAERAGATPGSYPKDVAITAVSANLGEIQLKDSGQLSVAHKNKYGGDYDAPKPSTGYK